MNETAYAPCQLCSVWSCWLDLSVLNLMIRIWIAHFGLDLLIWNIECQFGLENWVTGFYIECQFGLESWVTIF